jgi:hypothetical protein
MIFIANKTLSANKFVETQIYLWNKILPPALTVEEHRNSVERGGAEAKFTRKKLLGFPQFWSFKKLSFQKLVVWKGDLNAKKYFFTQIQSPGYPPPGRPVPGLTEGDRRRFCQC